MAETTAPSPTKATDTRLRYHDIVRWTHWLMAAGFLFMWASGYWMRNWMAPDSPVQEYLYDLHKSVGVTLVALFAIRVAARLFSRPPSLPASFSDTDRRAAKLGHLLIYGLIAAGLITGWALTDFGGHGVVWFGVPMPQVFPIREQLLGITLDPLTSTVHAWITYGLLGLVALHIAAVLRHRLMDGVDLLPRIAIRRQGKPTRSGGDDA